MDELLLKKSMKKLAKPIKTLNKDTSNNKSMNSQKIQ